MKELGKVSISRVMLLEVGNKRLIENRAFMESSKIVLEEEDFKLISNS